MNDHLKVLDTPAEEERSDDKPAPFDINEYDDPDYYEQRQLAEQEAQEQKEAGLGEYLNPEKEETDPNTTPIGEIDYFFHRPEAEEYEAIYYNPDAVAAVSL